MRSWTRDLRKGKEESLAMGEAREASECVRKERMKVADREDGKVAECG